jgi:hypothetical protein
VFHLDRNRIKTKRRDRYGKQTSTKTSTKDTTKEKVDGGEQMAKKKKATVKGKPTKKNAKSSKKKK